MMAGRARPRPTREQLLQRLPRGLRPKLKPSAQKDLALVHMVNLDAIARHPSDDATMWDWVAGVYTWWHVAKSLGAGQAEMDQLVEVAGRLVARFQATGVVRFDGRDYQLARDGVGYMDDLAQLVDQATAIQAAQFSDAKVAQLQAELASGPLQGARHD